MADLSVLVTRITSMVQDDTFPLNPADYEAEILDAITNLGYTVETLPANLNPLVIKMARLNLYYILAGKHSANFGVRIEGDLEVRRQQPAENYLKLALALEDSVKDELESKIDSVEVLEATRWRVSDNSTVPKSNGGSY